MNSHDTAQGSNHSRNRAAHCYVRELDLSMRDVTRDEVHAQVDVELERLAEYRRAQADARYEYEEGWAH